ncbi:hypothetical protein QE152_g4346 [Popillia japonica]|uniref:Polyprotein n=1 Tax=Popillia japonica TaxID=7064 RepID=A0AAW1MZ73_POPJA
MNNPSSRLTKFRLVLEEYDFTIHYIRGKENAAADALSRIVINSQELKNMSNHILVTTRSSAKQKLNQNSESTQVFGDRNKERTGHLGIVELLKRPTGSVELRQFNSKNV